MSQIIFPINSAAVKMMVIVGSEVLCRGRRLATDGKAACSQKPVWVMQLLCKGLYKLYINYKISGIS